MEEKTNNSPIHSIGREEFSIIRQIIKWLGSLQLAMLLLGVLAVACAVATIYESNFSNKVARYYIYNAPWFNLWLVLLCVNLFFVTVTRWPWQRKHWGFVITHYGIIILLVGAMIGRMKGFEGSVTLEKGGEALSRLVLNESVLVVESPLTGITYSMPFDPEAISPSRTRVRYRPLPDTSLRLAINGFSKHLSMVNELVADEVNGLAPGIHLRLQSSMVKEPVDAVLLGKPVEARVFDFFGRGKIELWEKLPLINTTNTSANEASFRETHMVFSKASHEAIVVNNIEKPSAYQFRLRSLTNGSDRFFVEMILPNGQSKNFPLEEVLNKPFEIEGTSLTVHVHQFWRDLKMVDGKPLDISDQFNNPAVLVMLSGDLNEQEAERVLQLAFLSNTMELSFQTLRNGKAVNKGTVKVGETFQIGWADWKAEVVTTAAKARVAVKAKEFAETELNNPASAQGLPGIRVCLVDENGQQGQEQWLLSGLSQWLWFKEKTVRVGYGLKTVPVNFSMVLEDFQVPRDEGTDQPADFISHVQFKDLKTQESFPAIIRMNTPASYPPENWRAFVGLNYKFSQAGWDPNNLNETTLQVLHDPGWFFKWVGALLICCGIFIMFYLKPKSRPKRHSIPRKTQQPDLVLSQ